VRGLFVPENDLERSLALATADPSRRQAFYRDFGQATVYFASVKRLTAALKDADGCIGINALEFLRITRGAEVILNPGSGCAKVFSAGEIATILDGGAAGGDGGRPADGG